MAKLVLRPRRRSHLAQSTMNTPTLLAIDSSTDVLCLAACAGDRAAFWYGAGGAQASAVLLGHAHELMAQVGAPLASLDAVAFGRGPGAFTGLRTACAAAQGLAFGVDCAVLPIDSLMLVAQAAAQQSDKLAGGDFARPCIVGVAMDARMGELYAGVYARTAGRWQAVQEPCLTKPDEWALFWQVQTEKMQAEKQLQEPTQAPPLIWLAGSGLALLPPAALAASTVVHTAER